MISRRNFVCKPAGHLIGGYILAVLLALAAPAGAQDWFTQAACAAPKVAIDPSVLSSDDIADLTRRAATIPNGHGRLWQITTPDGRVSHLWGTMHASHPAVLDLPKFAVQRIQTASVLAIESDPTPDSRAAVSDINAWAGFWRTADDPWDARTDMDPALLNWIAARVVALGYTADNMAQMTDAGLASLLLGDPCEDFSGRVIPYQDNYIATLAHIAGVPTTGLEPPLPILNDLNRPDMAETARAMVESYGGYLAPLQGVSGRATSFALYLQGRIAEMMLWNDDFAAEVHGAERAAQMAALLDAYLLDGRNRRFVANARPLIDAGGAFLAVGAFHLPGEGGMVTLLRAEGYRVDRVPLPGEATP